MTNSLDYVNISVGKNLFGDVTELYQGATSISNAVVGSDFLAAGAMSLATAGLLTAGVALPGIVVIGGVIIISVGFDHLIRAISGYWD